MTSHHRTTAVVKAHETHTHISYHWCSSQLQHRCGAGDAAERDKNTSMFSVKLRNSPQPHTSMKRTYVHVHRAFQSRAILVTRDIKHQVYLYDCVFVRGKHAARSYIFVLGHAGVFCRSGLGRRRIYQFHCTSALYTSTPARQRQHHHRPSPVRAGRPVLCH